MRHEHSFVTLLFNTVEKSMKSVEKQFAWKGSVRSPCHLGQELIRIDHILECGRAMAVMFKGSSSMMPEFL